MEELEITLKSLWFFSLLEPGPPSRLRFPAIDASLVTVSWDVPELTGGNITMYRVYYRLRDEVGAPLIRRPTVDSTRRTETVLGLSGDKYYVFEVRAHTAVGWGTPARAEVYTSRDGNKGVFPLLYFTWCIG